MESEEFKIMQAKALEQLRTGQLLLNNFLFRIVLNANTDCFHQKIDQNRLQPKYVQGKDGYFEPTIQPTNCKLHVELSLFRDNAVWALPLNHRNKTT